MRPPFALFAILMPVVALYAQSVRPKDVRDVARGGSDSLQGLTVFLTDPSRDVRLEAVKQITAIGTQRSIDPLIQATRDNDPEIQIRATDGIVDFYYPGYVESGLTGSLKRFTRTVKSKFTDTNDQIIEPYVIVRPEAVAALARLVTGAGGMQGRANAARAVGILRGKQAVPELIEGVHSKDSDVIYESLVALQKVGDQSAGPRVEFRLRDLDPEVQIAAIDTVGLLRDKDAIPTLTDVLGRAEKADVRRAALGALAMIADPGSRPVFQKYLRDRDEKLRAASAEGLGRLRNESDLPELEKAWAEEGKASPRISLAFAQVMLGKPGAGEFAPLQYLINNLNSAAYNGEAFPFLVELTRDEKVRTQVMAALPNATRDEKIGIARALARSGDKSSLPALENLSHDQNTQVADEGLKALRALQARL